MSLYDKFLGNSPKPSQESLKRYQEALADWQVQSGIADADALVQAQTQYFGHLNAAGYTIHPAGSIVQMMGVVGGSAASSYGPAGQMQRQGLGSAKSIQLLPEETCVQALVGWRRWSVPMFEEKLLSNNLTTWEPYKALAAQCSNGLPGGCQGLSCGCGIYSYKTRNLAESGDNAASQVTHVWGEVWLWGRVIEYTQGFRAQFAYPKAFVDTGGIACKMATVFGIKTMPYKEG